MAKLVQNISTLWPIVGTRNDYPFNKNYPIERMPTIFAPEHGINQTQLSKSINMECLLAQTVHLVCEGKQKNNSLPLGNKS